ncbi:histidine ammonia-lyase [Telmatobacter bradus]|uniref:histidine ammonia-lyase n=1 Tax=Telmatobacter bradus TaxID=474953 RepID=UPI003B42BBE4
METVVLAGQSLTLAQIEGIAAHEWPVRVAEEALQRTAAGRAWIEQILATGQTVYGVNTGFGRLADVRVPDESIQQLQVNLVRSHSGGMGQPLSIPEARAMLLLRANVLAKGWSGCRPVVLELLAAMLNQGVTPVIPEKGSVGASGDLAPLAHLALVAIGEGEAFYQGERIPGGEALQRAGLTPLRLEAKEGLALLNGTQAMTAVGALAVVRARRLVRLADLAGAMSLEALMGTPTAFDARIHEARPHAGQMAAAAHLRDLMQNSEIRNSHSESDTRVQDAYCLRCMPQVHGAVRGALEHVVGVLEVESGSATDNPLVFPEPGQQSRDRGVLSGGNFHGAPLSYAFDYASIVLTDLAGITERRIDRLLNPDINEGLPAFLSPEAGLSSGFMIAQIGSAALVNECQVLSHPSSTGSIPTSGGKEDHVSMGMTGALKLRTIVENLERIVAVELMCAAQGVEFRAPLSPAHAIGEACKVVRQIVPPLGQDRVMSTDIEKMSTAVREGRFDTWSEGF